MWAANSGFTYGSPHWTETRARLESPGSPIYDQLRGGQQVPVRSGQKKAGAIFALRAAVSGDSDQSP
jgi:hypothetical protein